MAEFFILAIQRGVTVISATLVQDFGIIVQLVILEGLLSFDNALALAALVKTRLTDPDDAGAKPK